MNKQQLSVLHIACNMLLVAVSGRHSCWICCSQWPLSVAAAQLCCSTAWLWPECVAGGKMEMGNLALGWLGVMLQMLVRDGGYNDWGWKVANAGCWHALA
jgi:hypothetical protein